MHAVSVFTSIFLLVANLYLASGNVSIRIGGQGDPSNDGANTIRIDGGGQTGSTDGSTIRIGPGGTMGAKVMRIKGGASITMCNQDPNTVQSTIGGGVRKTVKPRDKSTSKLESSMPDGSPGEALGGLFELMGGLADLAEGLDKGLNKGLNESSMPDGSPGEALGGLFGLMGGLVDLAEGIDKGLNKGPNADQCISKIKKKCTRKKGICQSSSTCNGKVIPNGCEGSCTCCVPDMCPSSEGFFKIRGSDQCFKAYANINNTYFNEAQQICENDGLVLAEPKDKIAPKLQRYLKNTHGGMFSSYWINGRGTNSSIVWQRSGLEVASSNSRLWWPNEPADDENTADHCVYMTVWDHALEAHPGRPYLSGGCSWKPRIPLCERLME